MPMGTFCISGDRSSAASGPKRPNAAPGRLGARSNETVTDSCFIHRTLMDDLLFPHRPAEHIMAMPEAAINHSLGALPLVRCDAEELLSRAAVDMGARLLHRDHRQVRTDSDITISAELLRGRSWRAHHVM